MKIQILSDLHLDWGGFEYTNPGCDLLILAGDTNNKLKGLKWVQEQVTAVPVVYVLGNHEYYSSRYPRLVQKLKESTEGGNIHILENDNIEFKGYRIFGATMWSDFELFGDKESALKEAYEMNDYHRIRLSKGSYRKLKPSDTCIAHHESRKRLIEFLESGDPAKSIVVTHHAPSPKSLHPGTEDRVLSAAYASDLEGIILKYQPLLWIHGHIHRSQDYHIGKTRIIANPRGYVDEKENPDFNPILVLEYS